MYNATALGLIADFHEFPHNIFLATTLYGGLPALAWEDLETGATRPSGEITAETEVVLVVEQAEVSQKGWRVVQNGSKMKSLPKANCVELACNMV